MGARLFKLAVVCSAGAFCLVIVAWLIAGRVDPRKYYVSLSRGFHLSIDAHDADARLEIFNDANYGPYKGGIIVVVAPGHPSNVKIHSFGDTMGIYYRWIHWPGGRLIWTLSLSLAYPLALTIILPLIWCVRRLRRSRRGFPVTL